jgi:hypothetical protein
MSTAKLFVFAVAFCLLSLILSAAAVAQTTHLNSALPSNRP